MTNWWNELVESEHHIDEMPLGEQSTRFSGQNVEAPFRLHR